MQCSLCFSSYFRDRYHGVVWGEIESSPFEDGRKIPVSYFFIEANLISNMYGDSCLVELCLLLANGRRVYLMLPYNMKYTTFNVIVCIMTLKVMCSHSLASIV